MKDVLTCPICEFQAAISNKGVRIHTSRGDKQLTMYQCDANEQHIFWIEGELQ